MVRKTISLLFFTFFLFMYGLGQTCDTISKSSFDTLTQRGFSKIATGQSDASNLSNYAAFSPSDGNYTLNIFARINTKIALNVSAKGGLLGTENNIGSLFADGKVNTNTEIKLKLHLRLDKPTISVDMKDMARHCEQVQQLHKERDWEIIKSKNKLANLSNEINHLGLIKMSLLKKTDSLHIDTTRLAAEYSFLIKSDVRIATKKADSLSASTIALQETEEKIFFNNTSLDSLNRLFRLNRQTITADFLPRTEEEIQDVTEMMNYGIKKSLRQTTDSIINDKYSLKIKDLEKALPIPAWNMTWVSLTGNWLNKKYRTYYASQPFEQALTKHYFTTLNFGVEFNNFHFDSLFKKSSFLTIGLIRKKNNNLEDLVTKKLTVEDTARSGVSTHTLSTTYDVYTDPVDIFWSWNLSVNYYRMFGKKISSGIHLFSDVDLRDKREKVLNMGAGYIFGFNNKSDKNVLNTELFLSFSDITSATESERKKIWDHAQIGFSVALPIAVFINKK